MSASCYAKLDMSPKDCPRKKVHCDFSCQLRPALALLAWRKLLCWTRPIFSARHHDSAPCKRPQADQDQGSLYLSRCPPHNLLRAFFMTHPYTISRSLYFRWNQSQNILSPEVCTNCTSLALCSKAAHQAFEAMCIKIMSSIYFSI
jgi:hypothetical protein